MHLVPFHCNHAHLCPVLSPFHVFVLLSYCARAYTFALTLVLLASPEACVCVTLGLTGILSDSFLFFASLWQGATDLPLPLWPMKTGSGRRENVPAAVGLGHCSDSPWASAQLGCHFERITDSPWAPPCTAWMSIFFLFIFLSFPVPFGTGLVQFGLT